MTNKHTFCIYSNNSPGMLHRITVLLTRRKLNIESLTVSETETAGVSRFTIVVNVDRDIAEKVARQIRRIVDVHEVFLCSDEELLNREVAMFKVRRSPELDQVRASLPVHVVHEYENSMVLEQTGTEEEINATLQKFSPFGVVEFVRSGRIAMRRDGVSLSDVWTAAAAEPRDDSETDLWF